LPRLLEPFEQQVSAELIEIGYGFRPGLASICTAQIARPVSEPSPKKSEKASIATAALSPR